jgi:hypothetical protein
MPEVPIPDDWDGETWECVQIQWPSSVKWFAVLSGLITSPLRGRLWKASTGNIKATQQIGLQIDAANIPYTSCDGSDIPVVDTRTQFIYGSAFEEEENLMSLCGYNPKAFKVEDGVLYVRDFCGDWVAIGAVTGGPAIPPDIVIPDLPEETWEDATSCSIASKLAVFVANIVTQAFYEVGTLEIIDLGDYLSDMRDKFPGIDLAYEPLINMYAYVGALDAVGYENEAKDPRIIEWLRCFLVDKITATNSGISKSEYEDGQDVVMDAVYQVHPRGSLYLFEATVAKLWDQAYESIGPDDARKITLNAQPTPGQSCDCPSSELPYTGGVRFLPSWDTATHPEYVTLIQTSNNGKHLLIEWSAPSGDYISDPTLRPEMEFDAAVNDLQILTEAVSGYDVPKYEWFGVGECDGGPVDWVRPYPNDFDTQDHAVYADGNALMSTFHDAVGVAPTRLDWFARKCPDNPGGGAVVYRALLTIYSIDGELV